MKLIFVSSPFKGEREKNIAFAHMACAYVLKQGHVPFAPHLFFTQFLDDDDKKQRDQGIKGGFVVLERCDEFWWFGEGLSSGMYAEMRTANEHNIPIQRVTTMEVEECLSK